MSKRWYEKGLRFECISCGRCCRGAPGYVWCSLKEIERISVFLGIPLNLFIEKYIRHVYKGWSLKEKPNGDCVFYDEKSAKCLIYKVRPIQCVTFPFWPSNLSSKDNWDSLARECPGINRGKLYTLEEIDEIAFNQARLYEL